MSDINLHLGKGASYLGSRIPNELRRECLKCFEKGMGYRATAKAVGLKESAVRDYNRRYKKGDLGWAERGVRVQPLDPDHDNP